MKIAFILGAANYKLALYRATIDTASALREKGIEVNYIFWEYPGTLQGNDQYIPIFGLSKETRVSKWFLKLLSSLLGRHFYYFLFSRFFAAQLYRRIRSENYDALFFHGMSCIPMHQGIKNEFIIVHSCKAQNLLGKLSGIKRKFYRKIYQKIYSDKNLLSVSKDVSTDMLNGIGASPKTIGEIYNGFNFARLKTAMQNPCSVTLPDAYIMSAGRPDRTKRFDILLEAYAKTRRAYPLVIFGDGKKLGELKEQAAKLGLSNDVIFPGFCSDLLGAYRNAVLYVSSSDVEGLPTVIVESLVSETPVVATDAGGSNELLAGKLAKWIVRRGDADGLAKAIDDILLDPPEVSEKDIDFLDYRVVADKYADVVNKSLERSSGK
ncbi:glycosyltransferase involved in cell wall biosynthesis [Marinobacter sp. MBR-99]|jgi:glycosyltransferase involved in cell wall biosynthesis|uniref:glycosyltransferase n=1 Tax=Marinobacter sp. MBR-99 TaxID=3156461 RepID=UPI00339AF032